MNLQNNILDILGPNGLISEHITSFEYRESQVEMAGLVAESFIDDGIAAIEAGTGTGKSFAYLLPAMLFCSEHADEKVVIATSTINLQHQLVEKDVPFINGIMNTDIRYELLKGRSNYICLRKLSEELIEQPHLDVLENSEIKRIKTWAENTETGMRSELEPPVAWKTWQRVCSESDGCLKHRCPHRQGCFVLQARKRAAEAQIIIINHHLLFADTVMREYEQIDAEEQAILPPYSRLIIDEAHNIEKNATSYFTDEVNSLLLQRLMYDLSHVNKKGRGNHGIVRRLKPFMNGIDIRMDEFETLQLEIRKQADVLDLLMEQIFSGQRSTSVLLDEETAAAIWVPYLETFISAITTLEKAITSLTKFCRKIVDSLEETDENYQTLLELNQNCVKFESAARVLHRFHKFSEKTDEIFWIEKRYSAGKKTGIAQLKITPVSVADSLNEHIFMEKRSVICTSATLAVGSDFSYWERQVGLSEISQEEKYVHAMFESPFNFRKHLFLGIPSDITSPSNDAASQYHNEICIYCKKLIESSEGGALILFTSYKLLSYVFDYLTAAETKLPEELVIMKQGDKDRSRLLNDFKQDTSSVLLATESFWEGVDIPGETLKSVIITRIPFRVPTNPVVYSRYKAHENNGGNSFIDIALPEAALRLKQGFGRLIRNRTDKGGVFILDSRIIKKFYGKQLLQVLPEARTEVTDFSRMLEMFEDFLYS